MRHSASIDPPNSTQSRKRNRCPYSLLLNVLWIVFRGPWMAIGWCVAAIIIMAITIIGLPWTRAAFTIAAYTLLPFGQKAVSRAEYYGTDNVRTGPLGVIGRQRRAWTCLADRWSSGLSLL